MVDSASRSRAGLSQLLEFREFRLQTCVHGGVEVQRSVGSPIESRITMDLVGAGKPGVRLCS